jgi:hypothetical protein
VGSNPATPTNLSNNLDEISGRGFGAQVRTVSATAMRAGQ